MDRKKYSDSDLQKLREKVEATSGYGKIETRPKKWMTAAEMGKLLGLKKTERYWLIHKKYFRSEKLMGLIRVEITSFEKWYANQVKYHKVTGEEPGLELKENSYSPRDIANLLGIKEYAVYHIIKQNNLETITVDYWKRIPKEVFWEWYHSQSRYRTEEDRERDAEVEAETITMPEMAALIGVTRQEIYKIMRDEKYKHYFKTVIVADRKRTYKKGFEEFLAAQEVYKLKSQENFSDKQFSEIESNDRNTDSFIDEQKTINEKYYLTLEEAAEHAGVSRGMISRWYLDGEFSVVGVGNSIRIPLREFEKWLADRKERLTGDGNNQKTK